MHWQVATGPITEPISPTDAIKYLRLDADIAATESDLVGRLVDSARAYAEQYCDRAFVKQKWLVTTDHLESMKLPGGTINTIESIKYTDDNGDEQTVDESVYRLTHAGHLIRARGQHWPAHTPMDDDVHIMIDVGSDNVPDTVKQAIRMLVAHYYEERRADVIGASAVEMPLAVSSLLWPHRVLGV